MKNISLKRGNAWVGIILLMAFLITLGLALTTDAVVTIAQSKKAAQTLVAQSLCDAGIEKAIWKLNNTGGGYIGETDLNLDTGVIDISIDNVDSENKNIYVTAYVPNKNNPTAERTIRAKATAESNENNFAFHYGIQVGETGLFMSNNSQVLGSVYSGGDISGGNGSYIKGDVYISKIGGILNNVRIGCSGSEPTPCPIAGDAHVDSIINSYIYGDAYYKNISGTTVVGTSYPNNDTPETVGMPLSENDLDQWKSWAESGGTYSGNYTLSANGVTVDLGPKKIDGNLTITNGSILNLTGAIWVTGSVSFSNNAVVKLSPTFGPSSGMIIADGQIATENNVTMQGSGNPSSYIMILSTSAVDPAIDVSNNSSSVVYYAANGFLNVANNAHVRSITGKGIRLSNGAIVEYDTGLANSNFSAGPGGSWVVTEWQIIH